MCSAAELDSTDHWAAGSSIAGTFAPAAAADESVDIRIDVPKGKGSAKTEKPADQHAESPCINGSKTKAQLPPSAGESETSCSSSLF